MNLLIRRARVLTLDDGSGRPSPRRGSALRHLHVLPEADVRIDAGLITSVTASTPAPARDRPADRTIDAAGRVLMPAFIDCHTHACWAGGPSHRLDEWLQKRAGVPYLDILASGGGLLATCRAVRAASQQDLTDALLLRLHQMLRLGAATIEVKSGYGLTTDSELKMLRAIVDARARFPGTIIPTALIGHAIDWERPRDQFIRETITDTLDAVHAEFPGITIDAFCEASAWSLDETKLLLRRARDLGHPVRVHADQFTSLGMTPAAIMLDALSVDHLEASSDDDLASLAASRCFGVALPGCGFHMDNRYASLRRFVDLGGAAAIATNLNPGSALGPSMPFTLALAARFTGLSPAEAIAAATVNPAALLGLTDRGVIAPGLRADLLLLRHRDERALAIEFGDSPVDAVIVNGKLLGHAAAV